MKIEDIRGVGQKKKEGLAKLGVQTIDDLLRHYPVSYDDMREVSPIEDLRSGDRALVKGIIEKLTLQRFYKAGNRRQILKVLVGDDTGTLEAVFFNANFLGKNLSKGGRLYLYGNVVQSSNRLQMIHPQFSENPYDEGIVGKYGLTKGISQMDMRKWIREALSSEENLRDFLPEQVGKKRKLMNIGDATKAIHFPNSMDETTRARDAMTYRDLFAFRLGFSRVKKEAGGVQCKEKVEDEFIASLPYVLTPSQRTVIGQIATDMEDSSDMNRLLQGDVGSGKTVVAMAAIYKAVASGYQAAFMVPTDILMKQHLNSLENAFASFGISVIALHGDMKAAEKRQALEEIRSGSVDVVVGTHALIQDNVNFHRLGLVITDEQHRFGVNQRNMLSSKSESCHVLVMTATPIPRTLAVIFYGDMDISVIKELPPGRKPIKTKAVTENKRSHVYEFVNGEVSKGRQAYVVAPLIEESESVNGMGAVELHRELKAKFRGISVGLLHGDMKAGEKKNTMDEFGRGRIDVLVSTIVIEVGIDVPNATVMVIENAERFGLSQMHQLRGRVGRGSEDSYCILINHSLSQVAVERAKTMVESGDGFFIADMDLRLRGPGEIFGTRQHGVPGMILQSFLSNPDIVAMVDEDLEEYMALNPKLDGEEGRLLIERAQSLCYDGRRLEI